MAGLSALPWRLIGMKTRRLTSIALLASLWWAGISVAVAGQPAQPAAKQKPEVNSPLGKSFFAKGDADGAIAKADAALAANPASVDLMIAAARARDIALQFDGSIKLYTKAITAAPDDVRAYRFRGHRYISTRRFDLAVADLEKAVKLAPSSYDVAYHLGLADYLKGEFATAARIYRGCLAAKEPAGKLPEGWRDCSTVARDDESRIAMSDWLYRALRRARLDDEAKRLLDAIGDSLPIKENEAYYRAILFYKGLRTEAEILQPAAFKENTGVTTGYGVANLYLAGGKTNQACALFRRLVEDELHWNAFGYIAAEAELARAGGPCTR
jgi:tetratricopeptide (TPR) repeat protein